MTEQSMKRLTADEIAVLASLGEHLPGPEDEHAEPAWVTAVGPCIDGPTAAATLGMDVGTLAALAHRGGLLSCPLHDGGVVVPAWQLEGDQVAQWVPQVVGLLFPAAAGPWRAALWMVTPMPGTTATPLDRVVTDLDAVLDGAHRQADWWQAGGG